jgi:hypothetical protein
VELVDVTALDEVAPFALVLDGGGAARERRHKRSTGNEDEEDSKVSHGAAVKVEKA